MIDTTSASQRTIFRGSGSFSPEENFSLKSRWNKTKSSSDLFTGADYLHEKCKNGCNDAKSDNGGTGSVSDTSSEFSAPGSAWELNKCSKTRNPVALGILWSNAEFKNDDFNTGCTNDRVRAAPSPKVILTKKVDLGRLKPLAKAEKLQIEKAERRSSASNQSSNWDDKMLRKIVKLLEKKMKKSQKHSPSKTDKNHSSQSTDKSSRNLNPSNLSKIPGSNDLQKSKKTDSRNINTNHSHGNLHSSESHNLHHRGTDGRLLSSTEPIASARSNSRVGWRAMLSAGDMLASSDPAIYRDSMNAKHDRKLNTKDPIAAELSANAVLFNEKLTRLISFIKSEITAELDREEKMMTAQKNIKKSEFSTIWQERFDAVERISAMFQEYKFSGPQEDLELLFHSLTQWKSINEKRWKRRTTVPITPISSSFEISEGVQSIFHSQIAMLSLNNKSTLSGKISNQLSAESVKLNGIERNEKNIERKMKSLSSDSNKNKQLQQQQQQYRVGRDVDMIDVKDIEDSTSDYEMTHTRTAAHTLTPTLAHTVTHTVTPIVTVTPRGAPTAMSTTSPSRQRNESSDGHSVQSRATTKANNSNNNSNNNGSSSSSSNKNSRSYSGEIHQDITTAAAATPIKNTTASSSSTTSTALTITDALTSPHTTPISTPTPKIIIPYSFRDKLYASILSPHGLPFQTVLSDEEYSKENESSPAFKSQMGWYISAGNSPEGSPESFIGCNTSMGIYPVFTPVDLAPLEATGGSIMSHYSSSPESAIESLKTRLNQDQSSSFMKNEQYVRSSPVPFKDQGLNGFLDYKIITSMNLK